MKKIIVAYKPHLGFSPEFFTVNAESHADAIDVAVMLNAYQKFLGNNNHSLPAKARLEFRKESGELQMMSEAMVESFHRHKFYSASEENMSEIYPQKTGLRLYWFPQVPCKPFRFPVKDEKQAGLFLDVLANYDLFLFEKCDGMRVDYCNMGGLEMFEDGEWIEWDKETEDDYFDDVQAYLEYLKEKAA